MTDAVGLIYETVAEPAAWDEVVRVMAAGVEASAAWMFEPGGTEPAFLVLNGLGRSFPDAYAAHYHRVDPLRREGLRRWRDLAGRVMRERDLVGEQAWLRSEIYNDLGVPNGIGQVLAAPLATELERGPPPVLSFFRAPGSALFDDAAVRRYERLLPHLQRATRLRNAVAGQLAAVPGWTAALLDRLPAAVILLDGAARVRHANARARAILDARDGLRLHQGGTLAALGSGAARQLTAAVARALAHAPDGADLRVPRPGREQAEDWIVSVAPLPALTGTALGHAALRCCVWIADTAANASAGPRLAALFGLTPAEQRVAAGLLNGLCPKAIARAHGVSLPTVRTQVQSVFGKLGVRRQAELVRVLGEAGGLPARLAGA